MAFCIGNIYLKFVIYFFILHFFHFPVYEIDIGDWTFMFQGVNAQYRKKEKT